MLGEKQSGAWNPDSRPVQVTCLLWAESFQPQKVAEGSHRGEGIQAQDRDRAQSDPLICAYSRRSHLLTWPLLPSGDTCLTGPLGMVSQCLPTVQMALVPHTLMHCQADITWGKLTFRRGCLTQWR